MSSPVAELEAGLQAMLALKPPGVSGSRIASITALCTSSIKSESVLIQKLYTHFKKAPATHKLGVLYVLDSVTRKWTEQAKSAGQPINSSAQDGSYAAAVHRVTELLPVLMNDIIQAAPGDQKEKIKKLVDIWEKGQTFPSQMITDFKDKLNVQTESYTPEGSPPVDPLGLRNPIAPIVNAPPPAAASNASSILATLANMARQNQNQSAAAPPLNQSSQVHDSPYRVPNAQSNAVQQVAALNPPVPFPFPLPVNVPAPAATFAQQTQGSNGAQSFASNHTIAPPIPPILSPNVLDPAMAQQLLLIKRLTDAGVSPEQIPGVIAALGNQGAVAAMLGGLPPPPPPPPPQYSNQNQIQNAPNGQNGWGANGRLEDSRDRNGYHDRDRSPAGRNRRRSRSRSPAQSLGFGSRRRDEPSFDYERNSPGRNRDDRSRGTQGGRMNNDYRQRSPPRRGRSPTPPRLYTGGEKWVIHDDMVPKGSIKVLSRTLFVGGVTSSEQELRSLFEKYGTVQTCIVNKDKRHAFVKMISRQAAVTARDGMEKNRSPDSQLRTRWGVGFGPRDCSDYQTGVSIIPITKLTDADRKWMLTAEFGGSGGKPIESGMVVEEPDIEIGQGVSSKAISRRMQTDQSGNNGPKSTRDREREEPPRNRRGSRDERREDNRHDDDRKDRFPATSGPPSMPPIPPFGMNGFPFTLPNGMPMFPPGFVFPGQAPAQPPAPGHRT